jgi:hypothetical protein
MQPCIKIHKTKMSKAGSNKSKLLKEKKLKLMSSLRKISSKRLFINTFIFLRHFLTT